MPDRKLRKANQEWISRRIFRENLRNRRLQLGKTQQELAEELGFTQQYLVQIERPLSTTCFPNDKLDQLMNVLQTSVAALYTENYFPKPDGHRARSRVRSKVS